MQRATHRYHTSSGEADSNTWPKEAFVQKKFHQLRKQNTLKQSSFQDNKCNITSGQQSASYFVVDKLLPPPYRHLIVILHWIHVWKSKEYLSVFMLFQLICTFHTCLFQTFRLQSNCNLYICKLGVIEYTFELLH